MCQLLHGHMRSSTAAALVGAGVLSVLIFPSLAIARPWERASRGPATLEPSAQAGGSTPKP